MPAIINKDECVGCGTCVDECPSEAITMADNLAQVDTNKCNECKACVESCPSSAITVE